MSKSLGNTLSIDALLRRVRGVELRYYLVGPHYRSSIEFSDAALQEAVAAYRRIESFVHRVRERVGAPAPGVLCAEFTASMDDDLGTPGALAAVHNTVREGNTALAAGDKDVAAARAAEVRGMLGVLGLDPLAPPWAGSAGSGSGVGAGSGDRLRNVVGALVKLTLEQRDAARARRDYATADAIRDGLDEIGVQVEDTPQGPRWELKR